MWLPKAHRKMGFFYFYLFFRVLCVIFVKRYCMIIEHLIKLNKWCDKNQPFSFLLILLSLIIVGLISEFYSILLPILILCFVILAIRISYFIILLIRCKQPKVCNDDDDDDEEDCIEIYYYQNDYWSDIITTITNDDDLNYEKISKTIKKLRKKYIIQKR